MSALDPRLEAIRVEYGLVREDFWELPQRKGTWLISHKALEIVAVKANITFEMPEIVEARSLDKVAVVVVRGFMGDRSEWSFGEASPGNNKNLYPFSMAEKRGKDRVILKLAGLHGFLYSEDEADDFKAARPENNPEAYIQKADGTYKNAKGYTDGQMNSAGKRRTIEELTNDMQDVHSRVTLDKLYNIWAPILDQWRDSEEEVEVTWRGLALDLFRAKRAELTSTIEAG